MRLVFTAVVWCCLFVNVAAAQTEPTPQAPTGAQPPAKAPAPPTDEVQLVPPVTWGAELDGLSRYVWRGLPYSDGEVYWPTTWVTYKGFTANAFFSVDPNWNPKYNEWDLTLSYERTIRNLTLTGSFATYNFPGDTLWTNEILGRISYPVGPGSVFTTHAWDIDEYKGSYYFEAGYAFAREFNPKTLLAVDGSFSIWPSFIKRYATYYFDEEYQWPTFGPLTLNVSVSREIAPHISIRPHITFLRIPNGQAQELLSPPAAVGGIALRVKF